MLQMGDTVGPRYTAPKISAISYLFRTFSLLIMGDTERPRYTGFRGLSVRGITALQCMMVQRFCLVSLTISNRKTSYSSLKQTAGWTSCPWTSIQVNERKLVLLKYPCI